MQTRWNAADAPLRSAAPAGVLRPAVGTSIFIATVVTFVVIALWLSATLNLYVDEAYSLHTTDRGVGFSVSQSIVFEQQPPLYFALLAVWRSIDHGIFFARLTSVACVTAMLFVVRDFSKRYIHNVPAWVPPLLIAINPFAIWAAVELRVYALITLLSALAIACFFRAFVDEHNSMRSRIAFTCVTIAAMYTQYFFIATFAGFGVFLLAFQRRHLIAYLAIMTATMASLLPMIPIVRQQMHDASVETLLDPRGLTGQMLSTIASFILPHVWINVLDVRAINVTYVVIFLSMAVLAVIGLRRSRVVAILAIVSGTIISFFAAIILVAHDPIEMPRHITTLFIPLLLATIAAVSSSFDVPRRRNILTLYLAIFTICAAAEDAHTYRALAKVGDWNRVSHFLETHADPTEPIAVFDAENALPIRYTYLGHSPIVPIPHEQRFTGFDRHDFAISGPAELDTTFPHVSRSTRVVWLVVPSPCRYVQLGDSCAILRSFVQSRFTTLETIHFFNSAVYKLSRR